MSELISSFLYRVLGSVKRFQGSAASSLRGATTVTRCALATAILTAVMTLLTILAATPRATAQSTNAGVSGRVTDATGAVIVDAEVEIKSTDTNVSTTVKTNQDGLYTIPSLPPGHYLINVRKAGFKSVTVTEVELNIQDNVVRNFGLQVGSIAETVTVNGNDIHINTTDASVSTVVDQSYVRNMPLNGRSFQDLILLTPGVVTQTPQATNFGNTGLGRTGEFSVNGQRAEANYYTVDGVSATVGAAAGDNMRQSASGSVPAATALGTTQALVSVDALQEFRVQSSTYSAEYGRNPGGQFAFETRSGTNQFHGSAYDYLRNDVFDATDWFTNYFHSVDPTLKKAAIRQNDFGGTLGGPVEIPGLYQGKNKTFFFVSYEGLRLAAPQAATINFVPSVSLRANAPAPLNQVLNAFPVPNGLDFGDGIAEFIGSWSNPGSLNSTSVRFDHVVNDKLRLFFRFSDTTSNSTSRETGFGEPTMRDPSIYTLRTYTGGVTSVFSSRFGNEFRLNYSGNETTGNTLIDAFGGSTPVNLSQLSGQPAGSVITVFICYDGCFWLFQAQNSGAQRQWNLVDTVSLSLGRHVFKFGADYRRLAPFGKLSTPFVFYGYFSESEITTNSPSFASAGADAPAYPLYRNFSAFAQDEWRVSQRLSLSMGLRWEVNPPPGVTQGLMPYTIQGTGPTDWSVAPQGTPLWKTTWYNFAPRLGVAYILHNAPGRETVVRGGGGVFFDTGQSRGSSGFGGVGFSSFGQGPTSFPGSVAIPPIVNPPVPPYSAIVDAFASHLQLPYTLQWNASIEQALGRSQALTVSYVGSHAGRLLQTNKICPNNPNTTNCFSIISNGLKSDYDALQVQFRRRLSQGLTALASYTWSHCIDYGSQDYFFGYQRGNCDFDVRSNLSAAFSYDLPNVGHNGFLNAVLHHWGLDDRVTARTAFPVTLNGRTLVQADGQQYHAGLNFVPGQPVYLHGANCATVLQGLGDLAPGQGCPGGRAINPQAFANVSSGVGNAPRNFARGFGAWQMDLAVRRDFPIYEQLKLQFRAEAFNIFNHPNFGNINSSFGQPTFGQATSTLANSLGVLNPLYQMGGPRSMQFALKLIF